MNLELPTYKDVLDAEKNIHGHIHRTAILHSEMLNQMFDLDIFFKCENFQQTGAFKFRGAFNALSKISIKDRENGVVAFSGGNHAQGIALAAKYLGISATVIMPSDAAQPKIQATQHYGANIIFYDRFTEDRELIAQQWVEKYGAILIPSSDHPDVIAGQGTIAKEFIDDYPSLDAMFLPIGGGGLLAGTLLSIRENYPNCQIYGIEPDTANRTQQALSHNKIIHLEASNTIADGARTQHLGNYTFSIIQQHLPQIDTVTDEALLTAMRYCAEHLKIIVEPTACLGFAGLIKNKHQFKHKKVGIILSGGNIDLSEYCKLLM